MPLPPLVSCHSKVMAIAPPISLAFPFPFFRDGLKELKIKDEMSEIKPLANGREARDPEEIPAAGWWQIIKRVFKGLGHQRVDLISAGLAFYTFLSLIPTLTSLVVIYGMVADPVAVREQLQGLGGVLPDDVLSLLDRELDRVTGGQGLAGWGLTLSIGAALWGASKAMNALSIAVNIAYQEASPRGFVKQRLVALILTASSVLFGTVVLFLMALLPATLAWLHAADFLQETIKYTRWPLLFFAAITWLAVVYRYAPNRHSARWSWITRGSMVAAVLWLVASLLLTFTAGHFFDYSATYGSLGAILLVLLWFYISSYSVLIGALINAESEHQTMRDTTIGPEQPLGERGAYVADHVALSDEDPLENTPNPLVEGMDHPRSTPRSDA